MPRRLAGILVVLSLWGCPSFSNHLTPHPTPKGVTEVMANIDWNGLSRPGPNGFDLFSDPVLEGMIRRGLSDGADIGIKLSGVGVLLDSRLLLVHEGPVDLAVVPGAGVSYYAVAQKASHDVLEGVVRAPLLAGYRLGKVVTLVGGLHLGAQYAFNAGSLPYPEVHGATFLPGGTVGVELRMYETFAVFPEVNVITPYSLEVSHFQHPIWQGGLSLQFRIL
jgi:hypothetical protein